MNCGCCFEDSLCKCIPEDSFITINTSVSPYDSIFYELIDKFNHSYEGEAIVNPDGTLSIPVADFPPGFFTQHSGDFILRFFKDDQHCEPVSLLLARHYDCISFFIKGGNSTKNTIGCEMNPVATVPPDGGEFSDEFN